MPATLSPFCKIALSHPPQVDGPVGNMHVESPAPGVLRLRIALSGNSVSPETFMLQPNVCHGEVATATADGMKAQVGGLTLTLNNGVLKVTRADGSTLVHDGNIWSKNGRIGLRQAIPDGARYYGFGQKGGKLDKLGTRMTMWNSDIYGVNMRREGNPESTHADPLYASIPFFIELQEGTGTAHGIFLHTGKKCWFDIGMDSGDTIGIASESEEMDLFIIDGPDIKTVVHRYTDLTGRHELPPLWAIGFHQCRWSYETQQEAAGIAKAMRHHQIPCDAIWLDIDYMDDFRIFTFSDERFPNPEQMIADFAQAGFQTVAIVDPGFKLDPDWDLFREGKRRNHFFKHNGEIYRGEVWPGDTVFPDFRNHATQEWFGRLVSDFADQYKLGGIWFDMNEPSDQRDQLNNPLHLACGNLYPHLELMGAARVWDKLHPGQRRFFLTRSACAGSQRYAAIWTGDNCSRWDHLEMSITMSCNLGLSGMAFVGSDVGGFSENCDGELLARWTQYGAFTPFFRNHAAGKTTMQEPWAFGPNILKICRNYINLRYRLLPYIYSAFYQASSTGLPLQRPMILEYPQDLRFVNESRQYMFGDHFIVAPVFVRGATRKNLILPDGNWVDYHTDTILTGPSVMKVDTSLEQMPLYVRGGAPIPMWQLAESTEWIDRSRLRIDCFPGGCAETWLYEDDGRTTEYRDEVSARIRLWHDDTGNSRRFVRASTIGRYTVGKRTLEIVFRGCATRPVSVQLTTNGKTRRLSRWAYAANKHTLTVLLSDKADGFELHIQS